MATKHRIRREAGEKIPHPVRRAFRSRRLAAARIRTRITLPMIPNGQLRRAVKEAMKAISAINA